MTIIRHGHVLLKRTPLVRWSEENGDFYSVLVLRMNCGVWEGGNWSGGQPASPVMCRRRHFIVKLQDNTQHHLSTPYKSPLCNVFSRSELHWNCIINRAEMIPSNSGRIHWPLRETRNKTMFLQEEYLTRGPITTSSIYSSKWARRRRNEEREKKKKQKKGECNSL